jgi:poly-beta-1,6-N-acetyl-D-glucosamine synthase
MTAPMASGQDATATLRLALITPARNEADLIEQTIQSVVEQSVHPVKWIIVSDGSTDKTDEIVSRYSAAHSWIELVQMPERRERHFAGKVHAFNAGLVRLSDVQFDVIGNLDADITFEKDYFEFLLKKFQENPRLGVAGTPFRDGVHTYDFRVVSLEHVSGACQLFRRRCFEEIGGYRPIKAGGIDLLAVMTARMKGWQTRTFLEKTSEHHRKIGSADQGRLRAAFKSGRADYLLGCDPAYELSRSVYRMFKHRPLLVNGSVYLWGYISGFIARVERVASAELVRFRRTEERQRLAHLFKKAFFGGPKT